MNTLFVLTLFVYSQMHGSRCLALTNPVKIATGAVSSRTIQRKITLGASSSDDNQEIVLNKYSR